MTRIIPFAELPSADLTVDVIYEGCPDTHLKGEPIPWMRQ